MFDDKKAWELHSKGLDAWQAGDLPQAAAILQEAIDISDPSHPNLEMYYGALGGVLSRIGRNNEARSALETALTYASAQATFDSEDPESSSGVVVARYFLGEHFLHVGEPEAALAAVGPSIGRGSPSEAIVHVVRARALRQVGRIAEAKEAAQRAVELATSEEQRKRIEEQLGESLQSAV